MLRKRNLQAALTAFNTPLLSTSMQTSSVMRHLRDILESFYVPFGLQFSVVLPSNRKDNIFLRPALSVLALKFIKLPAVYYYEDRPFYQRPAINDMIAHLVSKYPHITTSTISDLDLTSSFFAIQWSLCTCNIGNCFLDVGSSFSHCTCARAITVNLDPTNKATGHTTNHTLYRFTDEPSKNATLTPQASVAAEHPLISNVFCLNCGRVILTDDLEVTMRHPRLDNLPRSPTSFLVYYGLTPGQPMSDVSPAIRIKGIQHIYNYAQLESRFLVNSIPGKVLLRNPAKQMNTDQGSLSSLFALLGLNMDVGAYPEHESTPAPLAKYKPHYMPGYAYKYQFPQERGSKSVSIRLPHSLNGDAHSGNKKSAIKVSKMKTKDRTTEMDQQKNSSDAIVLIPVRFLHNDTFSDAQIALRYIDRFSLSHSPHSLSQNFTYSQKTIPSISREASSLRSSQRDTFFANDILLPKDEFEILENPLPNCSYDGDWNDFCTRMLIMTIESARKSKTNERTFGIQPSSSVHISTLFNNDGDNVSSIFHFNSARASVIRLDVPEKDKHYLCEDKASKRGSPLMAIQLSPLTDFYDVDILDSLRAHHLLYLNGVKKLKTKTHISVNLFPHTCLLRMPVRDYLTWKYNILSEDYAEYISVIEGTERKHSKINRPLTSELTSFASSLGWGKIYDIFHHFVQKHSTCCELYNDKYCDELLQLKRADEKLHYIQRGSIAQITMKGSTGKKSGATDTAGSYSSGSHDVITETLQKPESTCFSNASLLYDAQNATYNKSVRDYSFDIFVTSTENTYNPALLKRDTSDPINDDLENNNGAFEIDDVLPLPCLYSSYHSVFWGVEITGTHLLDILFKDDESGTEIDLSSSTNTWGKKRCSQQPSVKEVSSQITTFNRTLLSENLYENSVQESHLAFHHNNIGIDSSTTDTSFSRQSQHHSSFCDDMSENVRFKGKRNRAVSSIYLVDPIDIDKATMEVCALKLITGMEQAHKAFGQNIMNVRAIISQFMLGIRCETQGKLPVEIFGVAAISNDIFVDPSEQEHMLEQIRNVTHRLHIPVHDLERYFLPPINSLVKQLN